MTLKPATTSRNAGPRAKLTKKSGAASSAIWPVVCSESWLLQLRWKRSRKQLDRHRKVHRRLHGEIGYMPPVKAETNYYSNLPAI